MSDGIEVETVIERAIEEWNTIGGGPGGRPGEPTLARYITASLAPLRADVLNVLTVYDEHVAPENRGPWRDRLFAWATDALGGVPAAAPEGDTDD